MKMTLGYHYGPVPVYLHWKDCQPLAERIEAEDAERLQRAQLYLDLQRAGIAADGLLVTLETYPSHFTVDAHNKPAFDLARRFVDAIARGEKPSCGFALGGVYGTGKTTLVLAMARSMVSRELPVIFANWPEELERLKSAIDHPGRLEERLRRLGNAPVLILDDLGRERSTAWSVDQVLYPLVDGRYRGNLPTIVTTNESWESLQAKWERARSVGGELPSSAGAIIDRVTERCIWLAFGQSSRRSPTVDF
jgi:DNA replication protein DnaC